MVNFYAIFTLYFSEQHNQLMEVEKLAPIIVVTTAFFNLSLLQNFYT
jgi:hypothetical protein